MKMINRREELKARKQAYVQDEILMSAVSLFARRGFRAVTIDDIASSLGYTKSVVYYYFKSKSEILWQIFLRNYDEYFQMITSVTELGLGPEETLRRLILDHALHVMERPEWNAIYWRDETELNEHQRQQMADRKREYGVRISAIYADGVAENRFRKIPTGVAVRAIIGMCNSLSTWFRPDGRLSAADIAEHFVTMLMSGFVAETGEASRKSAVRRQSATALNS
ncbi:MULTISPECIES: TetR/AcrR family transcriptional regulator [Paraburkholderia]|uniref:TetR/AcrR family transcriptional regulator n=1 Tax=Paraburkholderia podalyriae TaxID=1938811 RepID=A0ABR7PZL2_9BURK|nr:TetR/AcrR family transcriptional regulator [Paraburkholderia podalyriae]MBC8751687.1 TetR/AcrR family transcriptional regulator [Paraburkholderia podalyriae]